MSLPTPENYRLLKRIGSGGFAEVWKAQGVVSGAIVAVKILRDAGHPELLKGFRREVRLLLSRPHANVVEVLSHNLDCATPFYAMPYFEHGPLAKWAGKLSKEGLLRLAVGLGDALAGVHRAGMVHGDVKPDNALVNKDGQVKHSDPLGNGFGVTVSYGTKWGGTPGYMAPEVEARGPITKESDAYSFGASLFHMITGVHPGARCAVGKMSPGQLDVAQAARGGDVTWDDSSAREWLNHPLRDVVWRLTSSDPSSRPSLAHVVEYLRTAPVPPPPPAPKKESGLGDVLAGLFVVGIIAAGIGVVAAAGGKK